MTAPARVGPPIVRLGIVESTQAVAWDLAGRGAPDGTVVVADHQTAGRGRRSRRWSAEPGTSLLVSVLARPRVGPPLWPAFSLAAAVAVAEALRVAAGLEPRVKWPNDVLVRGRKIAGILPESRVSADPVLVIGIGVNLGQRSFPPELAGRATSVLAETGHPLGRDAMLEALLREFEVWRGHLEAGRFEPVRERWLALADTIGRSVTIDDVTGVAVGLAADGALLVDDGSAVRRVIAGEIGEGVDHAAGR